MPIGTGLAAQLSLGEESTYGTAVTPSKGFEFNSESIAADAAKVYGKALRNARTQRADRTRTYFNSATGSIEFDVLTKGFGIILKHMLGAVATSQPDAVDEPLHYLHAFSLNDVSNLAKGLTIQVGRPAANGTVYPFTYEGCKITDWELSTSVGDPLKLSVTVDAKAENLATALATPTYPADAEMLTFIDGTLTIDGVDTYCTAASVAGKAALKTDRRGIGNVKRNPVPDGEYEITGSFDADFEDTTKHQAFLAGTNASLVLNFAFGEIDAGKADPYMVTVTLPAVEYTGDPPTVGGIQVVANNLKFKALDNGTDPIITIEYHTTDATP